MRLSPASTFRRFLAGTAAPVAFLLLGGSLPTLAQRPTGHLQAHMVLRPLQVIDLGAGRPTGFLLRAHNVGSRCVELFERTVAGDTISRGLLGPAATVTLTLAPGAAAFVQNPPRRPELRQSLFGRAVLEFEVINGTDDGLQVQFAHQLSCR